MPSLSQPALGKRRSKRNGGFPTASASLAIALLPALAFAASSLVGTVLTPHAVTDSASAAGSRTRSRRVAKVILTISGKGTVLVI